MTLLPLLQAPLAVQIHVATVMPAAAIGAWLLLFEAPGSRRHRFLGRLWIGLMISTALASFFIHIHGFDLLYGFSPIHLLSIFTVVGCIRAVSAAMRGDIGVHRRRVRTLYVGAIVIAGLFTLLPGRIMHAVVFGAPPQANASVLR